jgi:hypothetical protein
MMGSDSALTVLSESTEKSTYPNCRWTLAALRIECAF